MVSVLLCWRMAGGAGPVCAACVRVCRVRIANTHTPSAPVYDEVRGMLKTFLKSIMADTVCVCELTKRRTVSAGPAKHSVPACRHQCTLAVGVRCLRQCMCRTLIVCWSFPGRRRAVRPEEGGQDPLRRRVMRHRIPLPSTRRSPVSAWGSADCRCIRCSSVVCAPGVGAAAARLPATALGRHVLIPAPPSSHRTSPAFFPAQRKWRRSRSRRSPRRPRRRPVAAARRASARTSPTVACPEAACPGVR